MNNNVYLRRGWRRPWARAGQGGFTLMEIIVVVVLIGAIAAFAASRIMGGSDRARVNLARAQIQTLAEKVQQFQMDTHHYPAALQDLITPPGGEAGWLGPYAKQADLNDPWGHPIHYAAPGSQGPFDLVSQGAVGRPGGQSVDADINYER